MDTAKIKKRNKLIGAGIALALIVIVILLIIVNSKPWGAYVNTNAEFVLDIDYDLTCYVRYNDSEDHYLTYHLEREGNTYYGKSDYYDDAFVIVKKFNAIYLTGFGYEDEKFTLVKNYYD